MSELFTDNTNMAKTIRSYARMGTLPHAVILSGEGDKLHYAKLLAAAYLCEQKNAPCGSCNSCRKVENGIHPDCILVLDEDHKEIPVDTIRELRQDVYIQPNDGDRKVYIFVSCDQLNEKDQNVLLKIVEEGPAYACFIFCTDSSSFLLPTIRSRCVELKMQGQEQEIDADASKELIDVLCTKKIDQIGQYLVSLENKRMKREQLAALFKSAWCVSAEALLQKCGKQGAPSPLAKVYSKQQLNAITSIFEKMSDECIYNVGVGHVLGATLAELEEII